MGLKLEDNWAGVNLAKYLSRGMQILEQLSLWRKLQKMQ